MHCIYCGQKSTSVTNSRPTASSTQKWRRRLCGACHQEFTTYEKPDLSKLSVISTEKNQKPPYAPYSRAKLAFSIYKSFEDRAKYQEIEDLIDNIEFQLISQRTQIIQKDNLILIVIRALKAVDQQALLRYLANNPGSIDLEHMDLAIVD